MILKLQKAGVINILDNKSLDRNNYLLWLKLPLSQKLKRRVNIAKTLFNQSNSPIYNSLKAIFGGFDPENPDLITGEPSTLPSRGINPKAVLNVAKGVRTLEDYLKTTKVSAPKLEGSSILRNNYATDRFLGGQMFESSLPEEAMRVQGHGMAKSSTILDALARLRYILDNGFEKGKTFYTAPLKLSEEGKQFGAYLGTAGGTPYFDGHFLITGKPGLMINSVDDIGTIYINDAYQNEEALKAALRIKMYLQLTYPNKTFKLYSEGFKNGGTIKTANARKWKHKKGGKAFVNGVSALDSNPNAYKLVKKKVKMRLYGGYLDTPIINYSPIVGRHLSWLQEASDYATKLENLKKELKLIELLLKLEQQNRITDNLFGLTNTILNSIGNKKSKTTTNNGSPVSTSGTSSLLTNIGNTGSLSSNLNPMNFFGL